MEHITNAMLAELQTSVNAQLQRSVNLAADNAVLRAELAAKEVALTTKDKQIKKLTDDLEAANSKIADLEALSVMD